MRVVAQRVSQAQVTVAGAVVAQISSGLTALVGVGVEDTLVDALVVADKLANLRIFADEAGAMNRSLLETGGEALVVSQFTLYADVRRGRRPSYTAAAAPEVAAPLVEAVGDRLAAAGVAVARGRFGAVMEVAMVNQGPVTIVLETEKGRLL
jgi:D-tyrosyl-tRNA(Tyr) deacylase